ncbi:hypothetical protein YPPY34_3460 [Yersinia pestis PY-34]|uniref:Uncharacterized protein n=1 Tax=Yersinia pestis PY-08 TaxID=992134 RepID=A0AB72ZGK4_YERPE|nr:hypothetical protein YPPY01_3398 [Yersinia pestis PY-01]EIQ87221.1 hypothetical protein YPPY03_3505 [Yersinia pestis PY-03]EIR04047.1 hypothetical protein YPPY06_3488 [Yersinia pestis PY-06]EIR15646.1 hypothetical protein YPPY08_3483 [Yersinia pestis PY-08]EIR29229.1 hypothetical protein YPPY10_3498 [Yersinia pestis PY-10]EIR45006.1 hypothetical protein YPPY15_3429 [Yersinia pestis PY-15]EIR45535.1 hypothetical protein YPPY14_3403 [Yersinia pestis PY-14]EIR73831.1 hypothetical protein YPP
MVYLHEMDLLKYSYHRSLFPTGNDGTSSNGFPRGMYNHSM